MDTTRLVPAFEEHVFYDKKGQLIDLNEWGKLFQRDRYRRIRFTRVNNVLVSTIWLGGAHWFYDEGIKKLGIFETMIFQYNSSCSEYLNRYGNLLDAKKGHWEAVKYAKLIY